MKDILGDAVDYVFSSKTLIFIFAMTALLLLAFIGATVAVNLGAVIPVTSQELIEVWKWATGAGTARNVISDGVMPRVPQVVGAVKEPSVANKPVQPMLAIDQPIKEAAAPKSYVPQPNALTYVPPNEE